MTTYSDIPQSPELGLHAASLLIRRSSGEVLWVKRGDNAPFLAGYCAFPGGMVNRTDVVVAGNQMLHVLKHTAVREAVEEIGISLPLNERSWRFLNYVGHWRTHPYLSKTIEGYFFELSVTPELLRDYWKITDREIDQLWEAPASQILTLPEQGEGTGELNEAYWLTPHEMELRWRVGRVTFAPPTLAFCRAWIADQPLIEADMYSPELAYVNQVTPVIQLLPLQTPTLPPATHTNCYLMGDQCFVIVDPGSTYAKEEIKLYEQIDQRVSNGARFAAIVLTHHHGDHIGGVSALIDRYSVPLAAHPDNADLIPFAIDIPLFEGDYICLDKDLTIDRSQGGISDKALSHQAFEGYKDTRWEVWHTPGHAPGHLCLIHHASKTAVVGDMVAGAGTIIIDPGEGDIAQYLSSLKRLRDADFHKILPSHGPPLAAPRTVLTHYIQHRLAREEKVWAALPRARDFKSGGGKIPWRGLAEIVAEAYQDAPSVVKVGIYGGLAGRSALAHLIHLQSRGRALCCDPNPRSESTWLGLDDEGRHGHDQVSIAAARLDMMMSTLRVQCPWDRRQTLETLQRYLIEESYEVLDTLRRGASSDEHCDELGDLLFQVIFQSKIREEEGQFNLVDVMNGLAAKLSRRHPHVFGESADLSAEEVKEAWQKIKAQERAQKREFTSNDDEKHSILDGVPRAAPALLRAQIIGEKAATIGFDWPSVEGALAKVDEERLEVADALAREDHQGLISELGDLFFALVNVCRHLGISPEVALERTNRTFSNRFRAVEQLALTRGIEVASLNIEELEALWSEVKVTLSSTK